MTQIVSKPRTRNTGVGLDQRGGAAKRVQDKSAPPWKAWRGMSRHARAIRFIEKYCRAPKGTGYGEPLRLMPAQKEWLEETLVAGVDAAVESYPAGNGKSTFSAAFGLWGTFDDDQTGSPVVPVIATTVGQAIRSVWGVAESMVRAEPELLTRALIFTGVGTSRIRFPYNGGDMFPISNDVDGLQGLDPSLGLVDEIGFQPMDSWNAILLRAGKREQSLIMGLGTPGLDRENALWLLRSGVMEGEPHPGFVFREYAADPDCALDDRDQWRKANPALVAGFMRESALETALIMNRHTPSQFRIFRLGQWVEGVESWLGEDGWSVWEGLRDPYEFKPDAPTWIGVDVGIVRDSTAVVTIQERSDGRLHAKCRLWVPAKGTPVDVTDVMHHLRQQAKTYSVAEISFDPRLFDVPAKMLSDERLPMVEIPQSVERMTPIIGNLAELIRARGISHDEDVAFRTHVLNAVPRFNERGMTLQKSKSRGRIDACIALALGVDRALHRRKRKSPLVVL